MAQSTGKPSESPVLNDQNMSNLATSEPSGPRAERTRATILAAAEGLFARRGFATTRLEDVADVVGCTRAALFYYFGDKQTLHAAVLKDAFGNLAWQLNNVLASETGTVASRIEAAVDAWVDAIVARPTLARLILRIVADGPEQLASGIFSENDQIPQRFWALFEQGRKNGEIKPLHDDPFHAASAVVGTTVFYVAALAALVPLAQFEPLDPKQVAAHKSEALHATRRLLGIAESNKQ
jgi:TetR/AcrR family transcriptional regulator